MNKRTANLIMISLGAVSSILLLFRSQAINADIQSSDYCQILFGVSCDAALNDNASWQLYFPVVSMALVFFGIVGIFILLEKPLLDKFAFALLSVGLGISIYQVYHLITSEIPCPLCYINYAVVFISYLLTISLLKENSILNKKLITGSLVLVILFMVTEGYIVNNGIGSKVKVTLKNSIRNYDSSPVYDVPQRNISNASCMNSSNLHIIVFSSYECPACQSLDQNLDKMKEKYGESLCIEYRNFPLSSQCNPSVGSDMQPYSCFAAKASIAAEMQGKFDIFHHALFNSNQYIDSIQIVNLALNSGIDMEKWVADLNSPEIDHILSDDINAANTIGISGTPTILLNGKKVDNNPVFIIYIIEKLMQVK